VVVSEHREENMLFIKEVSQAWWYQSIYGSYEMDGVNVFSRFLEGKIRGSLLDRDE